MKNQLRTGLTTILLTSSLLLFPAKNSHSYDGKIGTLFNSILPITEVCLLMRTGDSDGLVYKNFSGSINILNYYLKTPVKFEQTNSKKEPFYNHLGEAIAAKRPETKYILEFNLNKNGQVTNVYRLDGRPIKKIIPKYPTPYTFKD